MKKIAIFGSTGSIGINTVKIMRLSPDKFKAEILVAFSNAELLAKQAIELKPHYVCIVDKTKTELLKSLLKGSDTKVLAGVDALHELAKTKVDMAMMAIVGAAAIIPTVNAIKAGSNIAMANKECLVCAGNIIMNLAKQNNVKIIPVDSEHSGLFQVFDSERPHLIKDVILTASGGPFRNYSIEQMKTVTKSQALKHPNWVMGAKITIDSATLVNKCLEVIEAYHLFPVAADQIKILVHPESIVHALVNYRDGSMLAQLSNPDMQIPISYALHYPERETLDELNSLDLAKAAALHFANPDSNQFKSLKILKSVLSSIDSNSSLVFNIANEVAVDAFLKDKIQFRQITEVIEEALDQIECKKIDDLDEVLEQIELVKYRSLSYISEL
jgi:1-deoxy-D-xylulose-5-phosphate reductoisomerase